MTVNIDSSRIHLLAADFGRTPARANREVSRVVESTAKHGNTVAAAFARESAGSHGKHYHRAFEAESAGRFSWVYGPLASRRQGGMSFERGSRNQPPHLDLARSADLIGAKFHHDVADAVDRATW